MPPYPKALDYIWQAHRRLRRRASVGFNGPQPISWQDIAFFTDQSGIRLRPWEIEVLEAIDDVYLNPAKDPSAAMPEGVKLSAAATDAAGVRAVLKSVGKKRKKKKENADDRHRSPKHRR